ncbi:hypothetical protein HI914_05258 [Erysiphe necator]|nr:hypothetical protein HI914_05258 [Erysiphe necator]
MDGVKAFASLILFCLGYASKHRKHHNPDSWHYTWFAQDMIYKTSLHNDILERSLLNAFLKETDEQLKLY